MQVTFLIIFSGLVSVLFGAVLDTFYREKTLLQNLSLISFGIVTLVAIGYSLAMAIVHVAPQDLNKFILDVSVVLLPGVSFIFAVVLAFVWLLAWRLVSIKRSGARTAKMQRNAKTLFLCSLLLASVFLVQFIVSILYLTVSFETYQTPLLVLDLLSHVLTVLAVLGYVGTAVISAARGKKEHDKIKINGSGYEPLIEDNGTNVPKAYQDF